MRAAFEPPSLLAIFLLNAKRMKYLLTFLLLLPIAAFSADSNFALSYQAAKQLWEKENLDLKLAEDQMQGALADKTAAAQRPVPTLSLNTTSIETGAPAFIKQADSVARIDQLFELGNKRELRIQEASLRAGAAAADLHDAKRLGEIELANRYYNLLLTQQALHIAAEYADLYQRSVEAAQLRVHAGDLAAADLARLQVDALRAKNDVDSAHNTWLQAQAALANYLNNNNAQTLFADDEWPDPQPVEAIDHLDALVLQRPDVIAADQRAAAAEAAFEQAQAKRTRDITVGVQVEHNGQNRPLNTVGVGISVPLSTSQTYSGEIARARADLNYAQRLAEQCRHRAAAEIINARSDLATARDQLQRFDQHLLDAAARALNAAELGYRHGALPLMDLLDARRTYKSTQIDALGARANYAKALVTWRSFLQTAQLNANSADETYRSKTDRGKTYASEHMQNPEKNRAVEEAP